MSWEQLGLFLSSQTPTKLSAKAKAKAKVKAQSRLSSKPIKKIKPLRRVSLKPGELDDSLDGVFPDK